MEFKYSLSCSRQKCRESRVIADWFSKMTDFGYSWENWYFCSRRLEAELDFRIDSKLHNLYLSVIKLLIACINCLPCIGKKKNFFKHLRLQCCTWFLQSSSELVKTKELDRLLKSLKDLLNFVATMYFKLVLQC